MLILFGKLNYIHILGGLTVEITTLAENKHYYKDVSQMIYQEFVLGTSSKMTLKDVEHFFKNTNIDVFPITFIAIIENECVGTVSVFENDFKKRPQYFPWLASLYVRPKYRDKKIGQHLITYLLNHLKTLNYSEVYLKTENASEYYKKRNWHLVESISNPDSETINIFKHIV